jgi:uncharacterized protein
MDKRIGGVLAILASAFCNHAFSAPQAVPARPSFDCSKAQTAVEKTICKSPKLSEKDARLSIAYKAAFDRLSSEGQADLRAGQRQWLRSVQAKCIDIKSQTDTESCLSTAYDERQKQLTKAVVASGGVTFREVDRFALRAPTQADLKDDPDATAATVDISYPQIERPATEGQRGFNRKMTELVRDFQKDQDAGTDYGFGYLSLTASQRMISISIDEYFYPHGAAHGQPSSTILHWLLKENRPLKTSDVFDERKPWRAFLNRFCFNVLSKQEGYFVDTIDKLGDMPSDPGRWFFTDKGLSINFNPYEVASYADGEPEVVVPWSALKPFLVADPAIR